jgi:hypothetical protein
VATLRFKTLYKVNSDLIVSPAELIEMYFFGTYPRTVDGENMSEETIRHYIQAAQQEIEKYLTLKFKKQVINETVDFIGSDYRHWGYLKTTYPVLHTDTLTGSLSNMRQIEYPKEWLSARKSVNDIYERNIYLVPAAGSARTTGVVYSGVMPQLGFLSVDFIPNYWKTRYVTGFERVPETIIKAVAQLAALPIFMILGDLILGAGIASQSISIDGLSQSISSTSSATNAGYGARVQELRNNLKDELPKLKDAYVGIRFATC